MPRITITKKDREELPPLIKQMVYGLLDKEYPYTSLFLTGGGRYLISRETNRGIHTETHIITLEGNKPSTGKLEVRTSWWMAKDPFRLYCLRLVWKYHKQYIKEKSS